MGSLSSVLSLTCIITIACAIGRYELSLGIINTTIFSKLILNRDEKGTIISKEFESKPVPIRFDAVPWNPFTVFLRHVPASKMHRNMNKPETPNFKIILANELASNFIVVNSHSKYYPFLQSFRLADDYPYDQTSTVWRAMKETVNDALKNHHGLDKDILNIRGDLVFNFYVFGHALAKPNNGITALFNQFGDKHNYFSYSFEKRRFSNFDESIRLTFE